MNIESVNVSFNIGDIIFTLLFLGATVLVAIFVIRLLRSKKRRNSTFENKISSLGDKGNK